MNIPWGLLLGLAIFGLVSLSRQQNHHGNRSQAAPSSSGGSAGSSNTWEEVGKLDKYDSKSLKQFITPLVSISTNAYSFVSDVPGWHPAPKLPTLSPTGSAGAHAVLYQEDSGQRLVLAFRGTLSQADSCVDRLLFGDASPFLILPSVSWCMSRYSNDSLDYLSQSLVYARKVVKEYSGSPLLLTGHSLGGALAVLVSVSMAGETGYVLPVVGFSCPGARAEMRRRGMNTTEQGMDSRIVVIGDEWDLVVKAFWKEQLGNVCLVQHEQPKECAACSSGNDTSLCSNCAFQTHGLNQVMNLLDAGATTNCVKM